MTVKVQMNVKVLKALAKKCDVAYEKLATAQKWGSPEHIKKAQEELDNMLKVYDDTEAMMKEETK